MKAIIIDDEQASRDTLKHYLEKYCTDVKVSALADSVKTGLVEIERIQPDIVFLDVEMPYGNAFDLLQQVGENVNFEVVFVTAFSHYALRALNLSAAFYILKPIDIEELIEAVRKISLRKETKNKYEHTKILIENISNHDKQRQKLFLPRLDGFEVVAMQDVLYCTAFDNYTEIMFTNNKKTVVSKTLKFYEELLSDAGFLRIHKSYLINVTHVQRYIKGRTGQIIMSNGAELEIAASKKEEFLRIFKG